MSRSDTASGLAVVCDDFGTVTRVLRDDLGLGVRLAPAVAFPSVVDRSNLARAEAFLASTRSNRASFDWELTVRMDNGRLVPVHFAGAAIDDGLLIIGARSRSEVTRLFDEVAEMQSEQATLLRAALKDASVASRERGERDTLFYDELSRLNNDLATTQRELAKKNAELARLNDQKNEFLGIVAHDLRNPLEVILSYSQFLREDASDVLGPEQIGFVETIRRSSQFMVRLVNNLLDVAKIEAGRLDLELEPTDLCDLVERNLVPNRALADRRAVEIVFEPSGDRPRVLVDAAKLDQVLNNLVGNAVKFSPTSGRVLVRVGVRDGAAVLSVRDDGPGIPPEHVERLFLPFERLARRAPSSEKGTGLGLAIVKRIVAGHGGEVWVETALGQGTEFFVSLPRVVDSGEHTGLD